MEEIERNTNGEDSNNKCVQIWIQVIFNFIYLNRSKCPIQPIP